MADATEEIKTLSDKLEVQLNTLHFEREESQNILHNMNEADLKDQIELYKDALKECKQTHRIIRQKRLEIKDSMEEIKKWEEEITAKRRQEEQIYLEMTKALETLSMEKERRERSWKEEEHRRQLEIEKTKAEKSTKHNEGKSESEKIRLPKLIISKFQGTHIDWWRFWNQFEAEIDRSSISQVTKFSYLKELLVPKVRLLIDGLPFTSEGYTRAKSILETKYGQSSEIVNAHIQRIIELPTIHGTNPSKIYEFYEKLVNSVQSLETMGKLIEIKGHVRVTLDKLPHVRPQLVQLDDDWKKWGFPELVESLRKWTERNPPTTSSNLDDKSRRDKLLSTKMFDRNLKCVYCNSDNHKSLECTEVSDLAGRKAVLKTKRLCFNCASGRHRVADCTSKGKCRKCGAKHHTSICDAVAAPEPLCISEESNVVYPVVIVTVNGIPCRALLDTGAGSSYASSTLVKRAELKPNRTERKCIQMMLHTTTKTVSIYKACIGSKDQKFSMETEMNEVDKEVLLTVPNPNYQKLISSYSHLNGVKMLDTDTKKELPIHLVLGAAEYSKIKTAANPRIGKPGQPVAELTKCGWTILSPGKDFDLNKLYLTHSPACDYEELCKLDVLGLEERPEDHADLFTKFKEQLGKTPEGRYETNILWKSSKKPLRSNKNGSLARLHNLLRKLQNDPQLFNTYDEIIQNQIKEGIVEKVTEPPVNVEFYLPHKPVVRKSAESTKVRIVYDASAKESDDSASLNDCVEIGPPLQNMLFDVLLRNRFRPVCLSGDMRQAFLQICIREKDRDALRFHWVENKDPSKIVTYRLTRAIFGLGESPFLLAGTVKEHLNKMKPSHPELLKEIEQIEKDLYVDDLISGGNNVPEGKHLKETAIQLFSEACIELHKWHSNEPSLEESRGEQNEDKTYAKQQLGVQESESKILGLHWDKSRDEISVVIPKKDIVYSKRGLLKFIASIYDPIGIISPTTLTGKMIFRDCCESKLSWDEELPKELRDRVVKWLNRLPEKVTIPRSIPSNREEIEYIELHAFGDASKQGVSAAVYAVVGQKSGKSQGLLTSKSRLASKGLTLPRLELSSCHMAANLLDNVRSALKDFPVTRCTAWTDNTAALHWIRSTKEYRSYVNNRVRKIRDKEDIQWRYVPTKENPADLGTRGCYGDELIKRWFTGPDWLTDESAWPRDIDTAETEESESEAKMTKEVLATTTVKQTEEEITQSLMSKFKFRKSMRVLTWMARFANNCRKKEAKQSGPLTTQEVEVQIQRTIKEVQEKFKDDIHFNDHKLRLNLHENKNEILECRGRVQGDYPVFIPPNTLLAEKLCEEAHYRTLHGGVTATMAEVRRNYWIPKLRQLAKTQVKRCHWCKRFGTGALMYPGPSNLPKDRTEGTIAFQVIGTDFAGPMTYLTENRKEKKAYILLFACSLSRAVHLELIPNQTTDEFIRCLKRFVARRGRPTKIYSDNAQTYKAAAKWLYDVMKSEKFHGYLASNEITWQFNLSRAPWWGGQFERIIGLVKQSLYKTVGKANLKWKELEEVILDIENTLNNRPLSYMEDDIEYPILTPNSLIHGTPTVNLLDEDVCNLQDADLRKRARYIKECKQRFWSRWQNEYLRSLRERHTTHCNQQSTEVKEGDVMIIKGDEKNRGKWKLGIVHQLFPGRDGVVRGVRLRAGKSYLDRAVQHLYPLELSIGQHEEAVNEEPQVDEIVNSGKDDGKPTRGRPSRMAAANARAKLKIIAEDEEDANDVAW